MLKEDYSLSIAVDEMTKEIDVAINREVHKFYKDLLQVGRAVWKDGIFFRNFVAPKRLGKYGWNIRNNADHSVVLARGRQVIGGKAYGSLKWYYGLSPMLDKLQVDIIKETDKIKV